MITNAINIAALGGKLAVESSSLNRCAKEGIKLGIDFVAESAKQAQQLQQCNYSVMGLSLDDIQKIKQAAVIHDLDRVILYPYVVNERCIACLGANGGNIPAFFSMLGIVPIEKSIIDSSISEQEALFNQYGVILYLRSSEK